jgi:glutamyl endopeptidase
VPNTSLLPWRCIARLEIAFASGARATGSGWFISPRTLATAGHNFWDQEHGRAREIRIFPGYSQGYPAFGSYRVTEAFWDPQWPSDFDERRDFALLHIDSDPRVGYFGYAAASNDGLQNVASCVNVAGYPTDKDGGQQYYDAGTQYYDGGRIVGADEYFIYHTVDTSVGQSGGPLFWSDQANRIGLGIHVYGTDPRHPTNRALRITEDLYKIFSAYKR